MILAENGTMKKTLIIFCLSVLAIPVLAEAQNNREVPQSSLQTQLSYAPVVKSAAPAVVNVYSRRVVKGTPSPFAGDPFFGRLFGEGAFGSRDRVQQSLGSGVMVRKDGVIVTNNHVVNGADELRVVLADRREYDAKLLLADKQADLAVLKIDTEGEALPIMPLRIENEAEVGDLVLAIGNPFGVGQTVTSGIVSALARTDVGASDYTNFIQTDAAINPGNSGGALVGMDGSLLGINTVILSRSGGSNGIGFAIPAAMVARVVEAALNKDDHVIRPWFGARLQVVDRDLAASLGLDRPHGALVAEVWPGGPAARAGVRRGDVVTHIDGHEINSEQGLRFRLATHKVGETVPIKVIRESKEKPLKIKTRAAPETPSRNETVLSGKNPFAGAKIANLSPALAEELGISEFTKGVIILAVETRSAARYYGLRPGDILEDVAEEQVKTVADVQRVLDINDGARRWPVTIVRGGRETSATIRLRS
jgi:Do/DeqQ family serine protease